MSRATDGLTFPGMPILEQTPATLRGLLKEAAPEDLDWQPAPDRWSIAMVLAHLADVEVRGFVSRFSAMAEQDDPVLPAYDQLDLFHSGRKFDALAELRRFEIERTATMAWLKSLPESVRSRTARHEEVGPIGFDELLNEFVYHDLGHIRQVMELYRLRAFYPHMGAFQRYYKVNT